MNAKRPRWIEFIIYPWLITFGLRILGPVNFKPVSIDLLVFLIFFLILGILGYKLGLLGLGGKKVGAVTIARGSPPSEMTIILILSLMYTVLVAVDFFVVKGGTLLTITAIREEDNIVGSRMSLLGGFVALTSAAPYILLCKIYYFRSINNGGNVRIIYFLALVGVAASFLSGGRNGFLVGMTIFFAQGLLLKQKKINDNAKGKINLNRIFVIAAIIFSMYLFVEREMRQGTDINRLLAVFALKWDVEITSVETDSLFLGAIYAAFTMLIFYITHPFGYIDQYVSSGISPMLLGGYNFPIPAKLIDFLVGTQISSSISEGLLLPGVYLTLPGSLYVDFGYAGTISIGLLIGIITGLSHRFLVRKTFLGIHFASFMIALWLLSPLYSMPGISNGFSFVLIIFLLYLIEKIRITFRRQHG